MKDYNFFNLPQEYGIGDYKNAIANIIKKYSNLRGLTSVYNWGDPSVPGISDIDLVFVFKNDKAGRLPFFNRSFYFLDAKTRYLVRHAFVFIDEISFKKTRYIYPNANFRLLHGNSIKIGNLSPGEENDANIALLNDIIIRHYPRDFLEQFANRSINVRDTLLRLNSLKYSIRIMESLAKEKNAEWNNKLKLIESLRKNWFKEKDFDLLVSLNENAIHMAMEITGKFRNFLSKNNLVKILSGNNVRYSGIKNKSVFVKNWSKDKALQEMSETAKNGHRFCSILPIELAPQLAEYSRYDGP